MNNRRRWSLILPGLYVALCALLIGYTVWLVVMNPGKYELAGLSVVVLGFPWSFVFAILAAALRLPAPLIVFALGFSCFLNGWILYKFGKLIDRV